MKHRWNGEKTIITYKAHNGQDLPLPRYYKTTIYTDDQRQLLWLYAEDKGVKWVKGFEVIGANTVNKDYYERLLKEKNENGIGLHDDNIEEIERKKAINRMAKLPYRDWETEKRHDKDKSEEKRKISCINTYQKRIGRAHV